MMNDMHKKALNEIENSKKSLYDIFGKTENFTVSDLEKYVMVKYGAKIYDSLRELSLIEDGVIRTENAHYYVDPSDIDIKNNAYKIFRVYEKSVNNEKHKYTLVILLIKMNLLKTYLLKHLV